MEGFNELIQQDKCVDEEDLILLCQKVLNDLKYKITKIETIYPEGHKDVCHISFKGNLWTWKSNYRGKLLIDVMDDNYNVYIGVEGGGDFFTRDMKTLASKIKVGAYAIKDSNPTNKKTDLNTVVTSSQSVSEELREIALLYHEGALTKEEFEKAKNKILK